MLKHILTHACPRGCSYCITKNIKHSQELDLNRVELLYRDLRWEHEDIMLTGGEPTVAKNWRKIAGLARNYFPEVCITTQNPEIFEDLNAYFFDRISFSLHGAEPVCVKHCRVPVFAAILANEYSEELVKKLVNLGYSGVTINEEQRAGDSFDIELPEIKGFSFKINRRGNCMDETIIMPDLSICTDFTKYL